MKPLKLYNVFWGFVLVLLLILSLTYAFISTDAPYYLSMARDIANGNVPYKDIFSSYTPVMMYLNSLIHQLIENPPYHLLLAYQYLITSLGVGFFYKICRLKNLSKYPSIFLSIFLFIAILSSDGTYINLEVYVIMFLFIAYYLLLKKKFFWCGLFLALGFFSKQYGIFNFLPFSILILSFHGWKRKYFVNFFLGGVLPLFFFLGYFVIIHRVNFMDLALQLTGSGYDQAIIELETTWFRFLAGAKVFILILIPLGFFSLRIFKDRVNLALIVGIGINLLPLYIQTVSHYFILAFPFVFILFARNLNISNRKFLVLTNLVLVLIAGLLFARIYRYKNVYKEQLEVAEKIKVEYPRGSEVFLYKHYRFLYILNEYQNPLLKEVGYRYEYKPTNQVRKEYNVLGDFHM